TQFISIDNAPAQYRSLYDDLSLARRDPVMQHCKRSSVPIVWDQSTYASAGQGPKWEEQASFGYRYGIAVATHLPAGLHFVFGTHRDQALPNDPAVATRMTADLQLLAVYAQEAALRLLVHEPARVDAPRLTPRELEALRWTMEGKTAWELSRILSISEQTAARHLSNATQKLQCANKLQAVLKAVRLRLIT